MLTGYLFFWGIIYTMVSASIAVFVKEKCNQADKISKINVKQMYKLLWKIINLRTMKIFTMVMLAYEVMYFLTLDEYA